MINLINLTLQRGSKTLFQGVNLSILANQRIGIVGENGAGKSSLFALLRGKLQPDRGDLYIPPHLEIAHLEQEIPALEQIALEYIVDGDTELRELERKLETTEDGMEIAELHGRLLAIDGYSARARAAELMYGLGFTAEEQAKPVSAFSGGWRMRLNLAKTLMCRSNLLLLDEPTNHLDLDTILWLEEWLRRYCGTMLVISHDRDFLDSIATHIIHFEHQKLTLYTGNYSDFEVQRAAQLALQQAHFLKQQRQRTHLQKFVDRFRAKASKAKQAQSRLKALARMEIIAEAHVDSPFDFHFLEPKPCSNPLLHLEKVSIGYPDKLIAKNVSFAVSSNDRIGLIGPNGAGKSTFIKTLVGELEPLEGTLTKNPSLNIGYFTQHQMDSLHLDLSPYQHFKLETPGQSEQAIRNYLGGFNFAGDKAFEPIANFSGGEKARLALALLIWKKPNLLLLDEPTNHLDLEMRQALTMALQEYQGAMIIVSHDRHLLRATTDSLVLVANQAVEEFKGDLEEYLAWLKTYRRDLISNKEKQSSKPKLGAKEERDLLNKLKNLEEKLIKHQKEEANITQALLDELLYQPEKKQELDKLLKRQEELKALISHIESEWFDMQAQIG